MSDLDDEELEATRRINGVAKESDIEVYKINLNKEQSLNLLKNALNKIEIRGEQLYLLKIAIKKFLEERKQDKEKIKELEAKLEFKNWGDLDNIQFEEYMNQFMPKQKVKDKIDRHKIAKEGFEKEYNNKHYEDDEIRARDFYGIVTQDRIIQVLEELLEEK